MTWGFVDIPSNRTALFFAIVFILSNLFFIFYLRGFKTHKWFAVSTLINAIAICLIFFTAPLFHANDHCMRIYPPCSGTDVCPEMSGEGAPCPRIVDIIYPLLVVVSAIVIIKGLVKTKKARQKIWPYLISLPVSFVIAILIYRLLVFHVV